MLALTPDAVALAIVALGTVAIGGIVVRRHPRIGVGLWLLTVAFVPIWVSVDLIVGWSLIALIGIAVTLALVASGPPPPVVTTIDLLMVALVATAVLPFFVGAQGLSPVFAVITIWLGPYVLGRIAAPAVGYPWISDAIAIIFTLVAVLAIVEFVTGWHGLGSWGPQNSARMVWGPIQERGGLPRVEGAFGHSIALGCSLAMSAVMTLTSRFASMVKLSMIVLQCGAIGLTFSRTALICAVTGLVLAVALLTDVSRRAKAMVVTALITGVVIVAPLLQDVFDRSTEAAGSAAYRVDLFALVPDVALLGRSDAVQYAPDGRLYFAGFASIDSQFVLTGVTYGWMALALTVVMLAIASAVTVTRRGSSASVAVIAQVPALATVALITQYGYFFWFIAGVAAADAAARFATSKESPTLQGDRSETLRTRWEVRQ